MGRARYSFWLAEPRKYSEAFTLPQPQRASCVNPEHEARQDKRVGA
jgi:hypothetical protein